MYFALIGALIAASSPTVAAAPKPPTAVIVPPQTPPKSTKPDLTMMLKMFDRFFPLQAEPDPARMTLARTTALGLIPPGSFGTAMGGAMSGMFERVLEMKQSELADMVPGVTEKPVSKETFHQSLVAKDPYFDERMRLTRAAVEKEFASVSAILEPRLREGLARAVARKLDQRQLADANSFFATDSGKALSGQMIAMWVDPDLMRSMLRAMPEIVAVMPGAIERVTAATAHLPKPPKQPARPPARRNRPAK